MKKKSLICFIFSLIMLLSLTQIAFASLDVEFDISIDESSYDESDIKANTPINAIRNYVTIELDINNEVDDSTLVNKDLVNITLGSIKESVDIDGNSDLEPYEIFLKPGNNKISIKIENTEGEKFEKEINVYYYDTFAIGATYKADFLSEGSLEIFNDSLSLNFPENSYIIVNNAVAEDNSVIFTVKESPFPTYDKYRASISSAVQVTSSEASNNDPSIVTPGTITISYDKNTMVSDTISIMYGKTDAAGNTTWKNIGAVIDSKSKTATTSFAGFGQYVVVNSNRFFDDYNTVGWAKIYADPLWAKGIMTIRDDDSNHDGTIDATDDASKFGTIILDTATNPSKDADGDSVDYIGLALNCTRADFTSMIVKVLGLPGTVLGNDNNGDPIPSQFDDIDDAELYDIPYIETGAAYGIINGVGNGNFEPRNTLTREQAAVIIARVMELKLPSTQDKSDSILSGQFNDSDDISEWASPYVAATVKTSYITGKSENGTINFKPKDNLKRSEAAKLIYLIAKDKKLL